MPIFYMKSILSGRINKMELPVTEKAVLAWRYSGKLIQNAFPQLTPDQREFLLTGATTAEWDEAFKEEEE